MSIQEPGSVKNRISRSEIVVLVLLILITGAGAFLRFRGLNWDSYTHIHPDERFLTMVETSIQLPSSIGEYFNTAESPLNPVNTGHSFFVYGTLPIFLVRYAAEGLGRIGYDEVHLVGRALAAGFDVLTILLLYFLGRKMSGKWIGVLAAGFYAFSVLPIQHSHFFVVDIFANTFLVAGFIFVFRAQQEGRLSDYMLFGVMLGAASACKISSLPFAVTAVGAAFIRWLDAEEKERAKEVVSGVVGLAAAAGVSFLVFRVLQPYAFRGPGFFGIIPDANWLANIREISNQQSGNVDFPPALQWAHRTPVLFSLRNMVIWGMGLPMGITAWTGWMAAVYHSVRKKDTHLAVLLGWVLVFFLWQSTNNTPAMRYQLPVYPFLAFLAAWLIKWLWETLPKRKLYRYAVLVAGVLVMTATSAWAFAFSSLYERPNTHVAASRWIYENVPAAINLHLEEGGEIHTEPLPIAREWLITADSLQILEFNSDKTLFVDTVTFPMVRPAADDKWPSFTFDLYEGEDLLASGDFRAENELPGETISIPLDTVVSFEKSQKYRLEIRTLGTGTLEIQSVVIFSQEGASDQNVEVQVPQIASIAAGHPYRVNLPGELSGSLEAVFIPYLENLSTRNRDEEISLRISFYGHNGTEAVFQQDTGMLMPHGEEQAFTVVLDRPLKFEDLAFMELELISGRLVQLRGSNLVSESSWDLGLPARIDGRDGYGGLYQSGNLEMYWPDNQDDDADGVSDKLERIVDELSSGDFMILSTNRQYGTIPRVPVRYPLSEVFYRLLFDCPAPQRVLACGAELEPYGRPGPSGYELVAVFDSHPRIGPFEINDQLAEEAFTVYDHPKVLVFQKSEQFDPVQLAEELDVDLANVKNVPPAQIPRRIKTLELPEGLQNVQREGGTWSDLFSRGALLNRSEFLAAVSWWLLISLLGWSMVPALYFLMPGLRDRGYGFTRILGLILLAWLAWMAGNLGVAVTRGTLSLLLLIMAASAALILIRSRVLRNHIRNNWKLIVTAEALALFSFLVFLAIRIGNPDLWHPAKGGEKPMNFAYLNAVLKSVEFPPYNPWFAGGTINYYYFGYVIVGMPLKLLGIVPSVGYNLIIPTLFSMSALGVFSLASNLVYKRRKPSWRTSATAGIAAVLLFLVLGNLGNARLLYRGFKQLGGGTQENSGLVSGFSSAAQGVAAYVSTDEALPIAMDRWYWDASRAIAPGQGEAGPITEFPLFTFLYGDLHAHMINLPVTILTLGWALSWIVSWKRDRWNQKYLLVPLILLWGLSLGAVRPTNTWDYPLYWLISAIAVAGSAWMKHRSERWKFVLESAVGIVLLLGTARMSFYFYDMWYVAGYTSAQLWKGSHTSLSDYFTVLGLFYFVLYAWLLWETRTWMEQTPITALSRLKPQAGLLGASVLMLIAAAAVLAWYGIVISVVVLPFIAWCMVLLLFRKKLQIGKTAVLLMAMAAAAVTLMVEVIVLTGDISRMNTVFKFYLQVWTLLSVSSAAAIGWLLEDWERMKRHAGWRAAMAGGFLLVVGAAMYPAAAVPAKIKDRMAPTAPHNLDGSGFMEFASYYEFNTFFEFDEDYQAIQWMQNNVQGSPVIVEASIPEYRWGSRYSIHTGLPTVLGWNWHQRQQQAGTGSDEVRQRSTDIARFYVSDSIPYAVEFLEEYEVRYVIRGVLERLYYEEIQPCQPAPDGDLMYCDMSGRPMGMEQPEIHLEDCSLINEDNEGQGYVCRTPGQDKYAALEEQDVLKEVFRSGSTVIYEVLQ